MPRLAKYTESILVINTSGVLVAAAGARINVYAPDTTNNRNIYSDSAGTTLITQPVTLGTDARLQFYVRSQDRTFDLFIQQSLDPNQPQFTTFTIQDESAHHDDSIFYVSEYATFQAAIDAATPGTKIIIDDDVTSSAVLNVNKADLVIEGANRGIVVTLATNANCDVFDLAGTRLTIRNFTISGNAGNQSGAGPYYGLDLQSSCSDCLFEDLLIINVKGDGLRATGATDTTFRRVHSTTNYGHGFSVDAVAFPARVTFDDCLADSNGTSVVTFTRQNGFRFEPPFDDLTLSKCQARNNPREGIALIGTATVATVKRIKLDECSVIANGGTAYDGLLIECLLSNGTTVSEVDLNGGHYSDNGMSGIRLNASETTNPGNGPRIRNVVIASPIIARNRATGIQILGRVSYFQVVTPVLYNNCNAAAGYGIYCQGAIVSNNLDDNSDVTRCRFGQIIRPIVTDDSGGALMSHAVGLEGGTKQIIVDDIISSGEATALFFDRGKHNVFRQSRIASSAGAGLGGGGGFHAYPMQTNSDYGANQYGGFWIVGRTRSVSTTETRVASNRITSVTRVLSLVPMDITAAAQLMSGSAGGWFHKLGANVSGTATGAGAGSSTANMGYLTLYTVGVATNYSGTGEFAVFCAEAMT